MVDIGPLARLGFGCSVLGPDLNRRAQWALLEAAFDAGIRHFDVAPSYGHGQAERALGEVLGSVREQVSIASKVGIGHPAPAGRLALARKWLRPLKRLAPVLWRAGALRVRHAAAPRGRFGSTEVIASVHESLRRLGTTRIDHLLLHEVQASDIDDGLLVTLQALQQRGLVGQLGLGTTVAHSVAILAQHGHAFGRVQTSHYWGAFTPSLAIPGRRLLTHRCLRAGLQVAQSPGMQAQLTHHPSAASVLPLLTDRACLPELLVTAGLRATAGGVLLLSSSDPARVRDFARWTAAPRWAAEADVLNDCLRQLCQPGTTATVIDA